MSSGPWEAGKAVKTAQVRERLLRGERPTDIIAAVGCSPGLVSQMKRKLTRLGELKDGFATRGVLSDEQQEQVELAAIDASTDLDWLRAVRNNPKVLWGDRIRASIAASKLEESKAEDAWTPPTGDSWRALLADLIASQSPEDRDAILSTFQDTSQNP